ncbi:PEP-CTERM sorting domain-containing protein [Akkermansiaceae bacterium]|nr:PEP-CTERM sorting domain-containing protein [Akkermansiaceae bacterium]
MKALIALAAALVVASAMSSQGQTLTWNLGGSAGYGSSNGNSLSFTQSGVKVTASAWSYTKGSSNNALESAKLGQWSPGLGVVNREENNSSPWHQVDNYLQNDYILFVFDHLVTVQSVKITPSPGPYDQDVSYWVGNIANSNLDGVSYSGLAALGFLPEKVVSGNSSSSSKIVGIDSPSSGINAILFGPERGLETDSTFIDAFKVGNITAKVVPEPSAALLFVISSLGFCLRRRR